MKPALILSVLLALPGTVFAQTLQTAPCNGSYTLHFGNGTESATGTPVGTSGAVPVSVTMGQCAREMVLQTPQGPVVLLQSIQDPATYVGQLTMGDGVARELHLTRGADRNLRGGLKASDGQLTITRPIWVMTKTLTETVFPDCLDDAETGPPIVVQDEEFALAEVLASAGYAPAQGFQMMDYIDHALSGADSLSVSVPLNTESRMIPRSDVALAQVDRERAMCEDDYLDPARYLLDFKVSRADADVFVFARVIDIETGKILTQVEGKPPAGEPGNLTATMADALGRLEWKLGPMKGPRG